MPVKNVHPLFLEVPFWAWPCVLIGIMLFFLPIVRVLSKLCGRKQDTADQGFAASPSDLHLEIPNTVTAPVTIAQIDQMDGLTFERFLKTFFEKQGYYAILTPHYDWGGDLVLHKDGVRTLVQAKRWKQQVSMSAVQEVVAAKAKYRADRVMVVTNSTFTYKAKELARVNDVVLWNRETLVAQLRLFPVMFTEGAAHEFTVSYDQEPRKANEPLALSETAKPQAPEIAPPCCELCGKLVTEAVAEYCRANAPRFDSKIYCFPHQKRASRNAKASVASVAEAA